MQPVRGSLSVAYPAARLVPLGRIGTPRTRARGGFAAAVFRAQRSAGARTGGACRLAPRGSLPRRLARTDDQPQRGTGRDRARKSQAPRETPMKREKVAELFRRLRDLDPNPTTELKYATPFELLVAVILSAQATDTGVNKATKRLF